MKSIHRFILYEDGEEYKLYNGKRLVEITKAKAREILELLYSISEDGGDSIQLPNIKKGG